MPSDSATPAIPSVAAEGDFVYLPFEVAAPFGPGDNTSLHFVGSVYSTQEKAIAATPHGYGDSFRIIPFRVCPLGPNDRVYVIMLPNFVMVTNMVDDIYILSEMAPEVVGVDVTKDDNLANFAYTIDEDESYSHVV